MINPCNICNKTVKNKQKGILCDTCDRWFHIGCNGTSEDEYEILKFSGGPCVCLVCNLSQNLDRLPFTRCDNIQLINIYNTNSLRFLKSLLNAEIVIESTKFSNSSSNEISLELPSKTSCKYYSVNEYQLLNNLGNLNIFHTNINGLGSKIDNLYEFVNYLQ